MWLVMVELLVDVIHIFLSKEMHLYLVCVCVIWYPYWLACPKYDVAKVVQPGFHPHKLANPVLESGCPTLIP